MLRTLRKAAVAGALLGSVVVLVLLVVDDVVVWGGSLLLGILGTITGLVFAGMARAVSWNEERVLGRKHAREQFLPSALGLERSFLYFSVPLLITGVLHSVSLILQGENLF